ncbi:MAG: hypothetical protein H7Z19_08470 [Chitinophagaceae bacterium]|nr:hypothetical protein [Rubrivivax sp.]
MAESFLQALMSSERGQVRIANLAISLDERHKDHARLRAACRHLLLRCAERHSDMMGAAGPADAMQIFEDVVEAEHAALFFRTQLAAETGISVGLTLRLSTLAPLCLELAKREGTALVAPEWFGDDAGDRTAVVSWDSSQGAQDGGWNPTQYSRTSKRIDRLIKRATERRADGRSVALGGGCRTVFITRTNAGAWDDHLGAAVKALCADRVRDYVGVPWTAGEILIALQPRQELDELVATNLKLGRPTAFEAWKHDFFRQTTAEGSLDRWGQTVDFELLAKAAETIFGAVEAILDELPLAPGGLTMEAKVIGPILRPAAAEVSHHLTHLLRVIPLEDASARLRATLDDQH